MVGLLIDTPVFTSPRRQLIAQKTEAHRRITQEMHEQEYQHALLTVKMKIRENEGADMKEMMMDQIRQWLVVNVDNMHAFRVY